MRDADDRRRPRAREPHGRPHRLQRRLRPAPRDRPRLHGPGQRAEPRTARSRAISHQLDGRVAVPTDGSADPATVEPAWGRFVAGVVAGAHRARDRGRAGRPRRRHAPCRWARGCRRARRWRSRSRWPSAATPSTAVDGRARAASAAETAATGVPGGLMDQLASLFGQAGHALLIDCRATTVTPIAIPPSIAVLVVHCGVPRTLVGSEYASRRAECEAVAASLGLAALRDATPEQVRDSPRARHVVTENARVLATADALPRGDLSVLGPLLLESHASLRDDFGVSTPELDTLVDVLVDERRGRRAAHRRGLRRVRRRARAAQPRRRRAGEDDAALPRPRPGSTRRASSRVPSTARASGRLNRDYMRPSSSAFLASNSASVMWPWSRSRASCSICSGTAAPGCAGDTTAGACCTIATGMLRASIWR